MFLKDTKARIIFFAMLIILIIGIALGYFAIQKRKQLTDLGGASLGRAPITKSLPGREATAEYSRAVEEANVAQVGRAVKEGVSAVPVLTRPTYRGPGKFSRGAGVEQRECTQEALRRARSAGVQAEELRCKGCDAESLRSAGYTLGAMREAGFTAQQLRSSGLSCQELLEAGFSVANIQQAGYSDAELVACFPKVLAGQPHPAGFPKDCSAAELEKAYRAGISSGEIRQALNCDARVLRDAGYAAEQLKQAGYTAGQLKQAGFNAGQLKAVGFDAQALREAGFNAGQLRNAGFNVDELKNAGYSRGNLLRAGFTPSQLQEVSALSANFPKDCSLAALRRASQMNVPVSEIRRTLGCDSRTLKAAGFSAKQLRDAGVSVAQLKRAGFSDAVIKALSGRRATDFFPKDCSLASLRQAHLDGFSIAAIRQKLGCDDAALINAGYEEPEVVARHSSTDASGLDTGTNVLSEIPQVLPSIQPDARAVFLANLRKQQAEQLSDQQRQAMMRQLQQAMNTQAGDLLSTWAPPPTQNYVSAPEEQSIAGAGASGTGKDGAVAAKGKVIKAGAIMFGVLNTGVNSDEKSPIFATIVEGELKGSKLLGSFVRADQKVVLSFKTLNIPYLRNTMGVNAVAIDPDQARTAIATHVDNHYLLRYGTLFASSFLSGLANAISDSGTTSIDLSDGTRETIRQKLNTREKALVALGEVGKQYSNVLKKNFTIPPTVKVAAGTGIGILFMQDFLIPDPPEDAEENIRLEKALPVFQADRN